MTSNIPISPRNRLPTISNKPRRPEEKYRIVKTLGKGTYGTCFLVEDTEKNLYVLKRMQCSTKDEMLDALKEMVIMRVCTSPFVVRFHEFFKDENNLEVTLVMEFCEEGDLLQRLKAAYNAKIHLPEKQIYRWFTQILLGLEIIHTNQFIHRDIKPANIFLGRWDVVKLGDFGLGAFYHRRVDEMGQVKEAKSVGVAGTPGFMAPEVSMGVPYDSKSDVYALGCLLYEMLTLRSAHFDMQHDYFPQPLPEMYSKSIAKTLLCMLAPNPKHRPTVKEMLKDPIIATTAAEMKKEQELLSKVTQLEHKIGYHYQQRRQEAVSSYLATLQTIQATSITDVQQEWKKMLEAAHTASPGVKPREHAPTEKQSYAVLPKDQESVLQNLQSQLDERKHRAEDLAKEIEDQKQQADKIKEEENEKRTAELEAELAQLKERTAMYEVLFVDLKRNGTASNESLDLGSYPMALSTKQSFSEDDDDSQENEQRPSRRMQSLSSFDPAEFKAEVGKLKQDLEAQKARENELVSENEKLARRIQELEANHAQKEAQLKSKEQEVAAARDATRRAQEQAVSLQQPQQSTSEVDAPAAAQPAVHEAEKEGAAANTESRMCNVDGLTQTCIIV